MNAHPNLRADCPNCHPGSAYCPDCGEKKFTEKNLSLKRFGADLVSEFTDIDSKFLRTLYLLSFRPGYLPEQYSKGITVPYIRPFRLFVIIAVVHFLLFGWFHSADMYRIGGPISSLLNFEQIAQSKLLGNHLAQVNDDGAVNKSIKDILSVVIYGLLFVLAWLYYLVFKTRRPYYSEHLVFFLCIISAAFLRNLAILPILLIDQRLGLLLIVGLNLIYVFLAIRKYYGLSSAQTVVTMLPTMALVVSTALALWLSAALYVLWN